MGVIFADGNCSACTGILLHGWKTIPGGILILDCVYYVLLLDDLKILMIFDCTIGGNLALKGEPFILVVVLQQKESGQYSKGNLWNLIFFANLDLYLYFVCFCVFFLSILSLIVPSILK